jgi:magnesium-transporting ATPase (P-type)
MLYAQGYRPYLPDQDLESGGHPTGGGRSPPEGGRSIDAIPFESEHKFMATLHKNAAGKMC